MAVIGTLRQKLGGILIFVIALAMLAFILMDMGGQGNGPVRGTDIVVVNGEKISYAEFDARLKINETFMKNQLQGVDLTLAQKENVRTSTFNEVINDKLKKDLFEGLGIQVATAEKKAMLFDQEFQHPSITSSFAGENGQYDAALFKQYLETLDLVDKNSGLTAEEKRAQWTNFEKAIYKERLEKKYNQLLAKSLNVPTWMAEALYTNDNLKANAEFVYLPFAGVSDEALSFSDSDLNAYLESHENEFKQDASVNIKYVAFAIAPSSDDVLNAENWMTDKFAQWQIAEDDSLFIMASSETRWDKKFYKEGELTNAFADSIFSAKTGTLFGPLKVNDSFVASKLINRKPIADSLKVRHLLITGEGFATQEEASNLIDSLRTIILEEGIPLASLTAKYSQDPSNAQDGGDLQWVLPGEMVTPFNDAIFYEMNVGDVKMVYTQYGAHFVEVYDWGTTSEAVKVATLTKSIFASEETTNSIFAESSLYAGNNRTKDAFLAGTDQIKDATSVAKTANSIAGLDGNAREMIKWAFESEDEDVSSPFMIGNNFVVALQDGQTEEGKANLESVRAIIEAEVKKEKKALMLKEKLRGSDLSVLASSNGISIQTANDLSFTNVTLPSVGNEPKVVATALGLSLNEVSSPIIGENGVFVVKTTFKSEVPTATDLSAYKLRSSSFSSGVQGRLTEALRNGADIEDNSFDFF
ncbi:MAG: SurA N-terminal domain-containing protein [Chitinophagales bacterium]|nr:SurA N-terminal domain-containing protein [Chitinophagales bacterium]|tara:strand:+ start:1813 stop:3909 length:2097 start_codon:yes stop_codon:yes gene_type:complete